MRIVIKKDGQHRRLDMKHFKKLLGLGIALLSISVMAGCAAQSDNEKQEQEVKVVNSVKGEVEIPLYPERIVDISGSTEELVILGYKPVATANVDSYETDKLTSYMAKELDGVSIVGHSMMETMDIEGILAAEPDLIIMAQRQEKIYDQLKEIAPVIMVKDYENDWRSKLEETAKLFDKTDVAQEWLANYDEKAKALGEEIKAANGDQSYLTVLASAGQFMIFSDAGIGTIVNDDLGLRRPDNLPVQDSITLPVVSMEGLTEIDADHIILIATEADKKDLEASTVWPEIRAVKEGNVTILDATPFFAQSYNPIGKDLLLEEIKEAVIKK